MCALKNPGMYRSVIYISVRIACVSAWGGHGALIYALQNPGMYRSDISILFRTTCVSAWGVVGVMVHRRVHRCVP